MRIELAACEWEGSQAPAEAIAYRPCLLPYRVIGQLAGGSAVVLCTLRIGHTGAGYCWLAGSAKGIGMESAWISPWCFVVGEGVNRGLWRLKFANTHHRIRRRRRGAWGRAKPKNPNQPVAVFMLLLNVDNSVGDIRRQKSEPEFNTPCAHALRPLRARPRVPQPTLPLPPAPRTRQLTAASYDIRSED